MTRRFTTSVCLYLALCAALAVGIVLRGEGPNPRVLATIPPDGDRWWPGGTAELQFSTAMDQAGVERALQVSPGSQGQGSWYGTILNLQPVSDWRQDATYTVSLTGTVADTLGRKLRTPFTFHFRVHRVHRIGYCPVRGVRNICEPLSGGQRPITESPTPVTGAALSPGGDLVAYTRADRSGVAHLYVMETDGTGDLQLSFGRQYADSAPSWPPDSEASVNYLRRPLAGGRSQRWNVNVDGTNNAPV